MPQLLNLYVMRYENETLRKRVTAALAIAARNQFANPPAAAWATRVMNDTQKVVHEIMWNVISEQAVYSVGNEISDSDLQTVVNLIAATLED